MHLRKVQEKQSAEFYQQLQRVIDKVNKNYFLVIAGDLDIRTGNVPNSPTFVVIIQRKY